MRARKLPKGINELKKLPHLHIRSPRSRECRCRAHASRRRPKWPSKPHTQHYGTIKLRSFDVEMPSLVWEVTAPKSSCPCMRYMPRLRKLGSVPPHCPTQGRAWSAAERVEATSRTQSPSVCSQEVTPSSQSSVLQSSLPGEINQFAWLYSLSFGEMVFILLLCFILSRQVPRHITFSWRDISRDISTDFNLILP